MGDGKTLKMTIGDSHDITFDNVRGWRKCRLPRFPTKLTERGENLEAFGHGLKNTGGIAI